MPNIEANSKIATGREKSMFAADCMEHEKQLQASITDKRILAVGAAGSIGYNTVATFAQYNPKTLHIIDYNENALAELVRRFRSQPEPFIIDDFRTLPLDYGSISMLQFLRTEKPYDFILNFAAIKHVRSEKDPFSTLQMFDTNILKQHRFLGWLDSIGFAGRYFSVSTDKAANPSSLMGATKRVMEHVMFKKNRPGLSNADITSARFANVAFSNGSLLESFVHRLSRGEPLACPKDISRYFVSLSESGEICTLAACLAPTQHIAIPNLNPEDHLVSLQDIAINFLKSNNFIPKIYEDEYVAKTSVTKDRKQGYWPLLLTLGNTGGEKPYEEFVAKGEQVVEFGLNGLRAIPYLPPNGSVEKLIKNLENIFANPEQTVSIEKLKNIIAIVEPEFLQTHVQSQFNLDQRV